MTSRESETFEASIGPQEAERKDMASTDKTSCVFAHLFPAREVVSFSQRHCKSEHVFTCASL